MTPIDINSLYQHNQVANNKQFNDRKLLSESDEFIVRKSYYEFIYSL